MTILKNNTCSIKVARNPLGLHEDSCRYYRCWLMKGNWPENRELIAACDCGRFGVVPRHTDGEVVRLSKDRVDVAVKVR